MKREIAVPGMGRDETGRIKAIRVKSGVAVKRDDELLTVQVNGKETALLAPYDGIVGIDVTLGDSVTSGQIIGYIDTKEEKGGKELPKKAPSVAKKTGPVETKDRAPIRRGKDDFVKDLSIKEAKPLPRMEEKPKGVEAPTSRHRPERREKMSKVRRMIADRLIKSHAETPTLTVYDEIDLSFVGDMREKYREKFLKDYGLRLGYGSFFIKAAVAALQRFPELNCKLEGDEIVYRDYCDIGYAVGTEGGLMVPVVRSAEQLKFSDVEGAIAELGERAIMGKLTRDEVTGASFAITNTGSYGALLSEPAIPPTMSGLLALHRVEKRPVVIDDQIIIRPMMYVALSYDERVVDGQTAVGFLAQFKEALEDPARLF